MEAQGEAPRVLVSVHGIRTFGQWQDRLASLVRAANSSVLAYSYNYGFFSMLAFLIPPLRGIEVKRFRRHLLRILARHPDAEILLVGHSFGTHLIGWALSGGLGSHAKPIDLVLVSGSVLKSTFDWHALVDNGVVRKVVNDCGTRDNILLLSQFLVLFTGMAGRIGFAGPGGLYLFNRFFDGGHSLYFVDEAGRPDDAFMQRYWVPLLAGRGPIEPVDHRRAAGPLAGAHLWLIQNADVLKIGLLVVAAGSLWQTLYATPHALAEAANLDRLRAGARGQLSIDEQVPEGVATLLHVVGRDPSDESSRELALLWLPQLIDIQDVITDRGLPALLVWNGQNILVSGSAMRILSGPVAIGHAFSRDRRHLILFDADRAIRVFEVENGALIRSIETLETPRTVEPAASEPEGESQEVIDTIFDVLTPIFPDLERNSVQVPQLRSVQFLESPDGEYLWAECWTDSESAGGTDPGLFVFHRASGNHAFYSASDGIALTGEGGRLRSFVRDVDHDLDLEKQRRTGAAQSAGSLSASTGPKFVELIWPSEKAGFRANHIDSAPASVASDIRARKRLLESAAALGLRIGSVAETKAASNEVDADTSMGERLKLTFPGLSKAGRSWVRLDGSPEEHAQLGTSRGPLRQIEEAELETLAAVLAPWTRAHPDDPATTYLEVFALEGRPHDAWKLVGPNRTHYFFTGADGSKYGALVFCSGAGPGAQVDACKYLRFRGNFGSLAVSENGRYLAVGDLAGLGQPGIHLWDLQQMAAVDLDRQPPEGVDHVHIAGDRLFASTAAGVYHFVLGAKATLQGLVRVPRPPSSDEPGEEGSGPAFVVQDGRLVLVTESGLVQAVDADTGNAAWLSRVTPGAFPGISTAPGLPFLVVHTDGCAHFLHLRTGARVAPEFCSNIEEVRVAVGGQVFLQTAEGWLSRTVAPAKDAGNLLPSQRSLSVLDSIRQRWAAPYRTDALDTLRRLTGHRFDGPSIQRLEALPLKLLCQVDSAVECAKN